MWIAEFIGILVFILGSWVLTAYLRERWAKRRRKTMDQHFEEYWTWKQQNMNKENRK